MSFKQNSDVIRFLSCKSFLRPSKLDKLEQVKTRNKVSSKVNALIWMGSGEGLSLEIPIRMEPRAIIQKIFGRYLKTAYLWTKHLLIKDKPETVLKNLLKRKEVLFLFKILGW